MPREAPQRVASALTDSSAELLASSISDTSPRKKAFNHPGELRKVFGESFGETAVKLSWFSRNSRKETRKQQIERKLRAERWDVVVLESILQLGGVFLPAGSGFHNTVVLPFWIIGFIIRLKLLFHLRGQFILKQISRM
jgi:hypothetical protein